MKILLVDDDLCSRESVGSFLYMAGHEVIECQTGQEALKVLKTKSVELVVTDLKMPGMSGVDLLKEIARVTEDPPFIVLLTGYGTIESAVDALKNGAVDYLLKPVSAESLAKVIEGIETHPLYKLKCANLADRSPSSRSYTVNRVKIHAFCKQYVEVFEQALAYHKERSIPVIIEGETGTGKELVARLIHYGTDREEPPLVDLNCAAIPASLFESDLFGYEPGAFTGGLAKGGKGKIDSAEGGSLFLDEIAEIPVEIQSKLLRFLQEKEFYRVAGSKKIKVDVRIICATNKKLERAVAEGTFRADLYYRLKMGKIYIPPLRQCRDQILPLAEAFMHECSRQKKKAFRWISSEAAILLVQYDWPGNIRELKNVIEWVVSMHDGTKIKGEHLAVIQPSQKDELSPVHRKGSLVNLLTDKRIEAALAETRGNKKAAADILGISRRTIYRYLERAKAYDNEKRE